MRPDDRRGSTIDRRSRSGPNAHAASGGGAPRRGVGVVRPARSSAPGARRCCADDVCRDPRCGGRDRGIGITDDRGGIAPIGADCAARRRRTAGNAGRRSAGRGRCFRRRDGRSARTARGTAHGRGNEYSLRSGVDDRHFGFRSRAAEGAARESAAAAIVFIDPRTSSSERGEAPCDPIARPTPIGEDGRGAIDVG